MEDVGLELRVQKFSFWNLGSFCDNQIVWLEKSFCVSRPRTSNFFGVLKLRGQFPGLLFVMQLCQQIGEACNFKYTLKGNRKYNRFLTVLGMQDRFSPANKQLSFHEKSSSVTLEHCTI